MQGFELLDSGDLRKIEKIGGFIFVRPQANAIWKLSNPDLLHKADYIFSREEKNKWDIKNNLKNTFILELENIFMKIKLTDFGHIGIFFEHINLINKLLEKYKNKNKNKKLKILNLFAYTGLASIKFSKEGHFITHVDSSKPTILWAQENAKLNNISNIRFLIDDAMKFLKKEINRGVKYDGIILDPPSFGRGPKGEVFKIEEDICQLLELSKNVLKENFSFFAFTCHTPGFTKTVLQNLIEDIFNNNKNIAIDEMLIDSKSEKIKNLPAGFFVIIEN
ncbi:MAG: hypothetical protein A3F40_01515 [Chlamydiae bacterium RIFCSPHIGHO2_12_FULL_27_8]|nr:MAG: hypothetical protein A3F40_01515 [Chlamydiae bacterium RIFCSPHIGHO2_12_FULL_27_8]